MLTRLRPAVAAVYTLARMVADDWWQYFIVYGAGFAIWVNGVFIPLWKKHSVDLSGLSLVITASGAVLAAHVGINAWRDIRTAQAGEQSNAS